MRWPRLLFVFRLPWWLLIFGLLFAVMFWAVWAELWLLAQAALLIIDTANWAVERHATRKERNLDHV